MSHGPRYRVGIRRRREGKTDYRKRLNLLKSRKTRIVIRKSLKHVRVQFINYDETGDKIVASAISNELTHKYNWKFSTKNTSAAYLTGLLAGKKAVDQGVKEGVLDIGRQIPADGSKVFAALKGIMDAGVTCPCDEGKIPSEDRILGKHVDEKISTMVNEVKSKISGGK